jgi:hypothetical protein
MLLPLVSNLLDKVPNTPALLLQSGIMGIRVSLNQRVAKIEGCGFGHGGILLVWRDSPKM